MMNPTFQIGKIVSELEAMIQSPRLFFTNDSTAVLNFLSGFHWGVGQFIDLDDYWRIVEDVLNERGWEQSAHHISYQMSVKGYSEPEINHEVLEIEIETWKRVIERLKAGA